MKKTILTLSMAVMFVGTGLLANATPIKNQIKLEKSKANYDLSSFCKAVMQGDIETVERMIEWGEDVNKKSLGMTPAMFAARYNKAEVLQMLIDHGADLSAKSDQGYSVAKYAELSNATDALAVLEGASGS